MKWYSYCALIFVLIIFYFGYLQYLPCYSDKIRANDNAKCIKDCNENSGCIHGCSDAYSCEPNIQPYLIFIAINHIVKGELNPTLNK